MSSNNSKHKNLLQKIESGYFNSLVAANKSIDNIAKGCSTNEIEQLRAAARLTYSVRADPAPKREPRTHKTDNYRKVEDRLNNKVFSHRKSARAAVHTYKRNYLSMGEPKDRAKFNELMALVEKKYPQTQAPAVSPIPDVPASDPYRDMLGAQGSIKFSTPQMSLEVTGDVVRFARELGLDAIIKANAQHMEHVNASVQRHYQREFGGAVPGEDLEFASGAEVPGDGVPSGIVFDRELEDGEMYPAGVLRRWGLDRNLTTSELNSLMGNYTSLASEVLPNGAEKRTKNGEPVNLRFTSSSGQAVDRNIVVVKMPRDTAIIYGALLMTKSREVKGKPKYLADFDPTTSSPMQDDIMAACGDDEACEIAIKLGPVMARKGVDFNGLDKIAASGIASRKAN